MLKKSELYQAESFEYTYTEEDFWSYIILHLYVWPGCHAMIFYC